MSSLFPPLTPATAAPIFACMSPSAADLFRLRWTASIERDADGAPLLPPLFVAGQGSDVSLVDLRAPEEASGVLGYLPGSIFVDAGAVPTDRPVVFVSASGRRAAEAARRLEQAGRSDVAALAGGIVGWRKIGLKTSHDDHDVRRRPYAPAPAPSAGSVSRERVEAHIGDPRNVRWIKLASMINSAHCSCIDGRDARAVVGTLGGDAGEFLLSLAALERGAGLVLDEETVGSALAAHADAYGEFYMHSDVDAFDALTTSMCADERLDCPADAEGAIALVRQPDPALRETLLEHLVQPAHIGCGHIRLMLLHGDEYGIRPEVVVWFLRAFYRQWWDGTPELSPTLLPGLHEEAAVLDIRLDEPLWGPTPIPLVSPACDGLQMFIYHSDVNAYLRDSFVRFHLSGFGAVHVAAEREADLRAAYRDLGNQQLAATLGHLASGLPIYEVVFAADGSFSVRET